MRFVDNTQNVMRDRRSKGVRVLAPGLWRCATSSLQIAFEEKIKPPMAPSMHGAVIMPDWRYMKLCTEACREESTERRRKLLSQIFTGFNASSDYPGMAFADDLMDMYPDMKVVLNKRASAAAWSISVNESLRFFSTKRYMLLTYWVPQSYWHHRIYTDYLLLVNRRFGNVDIWSQDYYELHNQWIRDAARERGRPILEWEPSMGWKPLCEFLGVEIPEGDLPRVNESAAIAELKRFLVIRGLLVWLAVITALICACWTLTKI